MAAAHVGTTALLHPDHSDQAPDLVSVLASDPENLPESVGDLLTWHARRDPAATALLAPGYPPISYAELADLVTATGVRLVESGLRLDSRVVIAPPEGLHGVVLLLALLDVAACCPINPAFTRPEVAALFDVLGPAAAVVPAGADSALRDVAAQHGVPVIEVRGLPGDPRPHLTGGGALIRRRRTDTTPEAQSAASAALLLRTSGTSSAGKLVALSTGNVMAGAAATVRAYRLTPADRRLNFMPLFHVQGLVGSVIAALLAGSSAACLSVFEPLRVLRALGEYEASWFSASPAMHRALLDAAAPGTYSFPRLRFVRCGSGALPGPLRAELEARYCVPVIESYGMTEAHQIASTPLYPLDGTPAPRMVPTGARVAVLDANGAVREETGVEGEIVLRGPNVVSCYAAPAEANEAAFVEGWFRTGDHGALAADGSLVLRGRIKDLIDRGGEKIAPIEVEEALLRHPDVLEAVAFPVPDQVFGEQVGAAVVLRGEAHARRGSNIEVELARFAAQSLAPFKVPRRIVVCESLPTNATGKVSRGEVAAQYATAPELSVSAPRSAPPDGASASDVAAHEAGDGPRNAWEAAVLGLWSFALRGTPVRPDDDFLSLGGDSLSAVALLAAVEDVLGLRLSPADVFDRMPTAAEMAAALAKLAAAERT